MQTVLRQIRHATRLIAAAPLFAATAVLSLAVGVGANTAIFTVANALFFAPTTGVTDMDRLVDLGRTVDGAGFDTVSYATYRDLQERNPVFSGVYAYRLEPMAVSLGTEMGADRIYGEQVSASYFDVLGLTPSAGTFFRTSDDRDGVPLRKVVLSHAFWQSRFGGAADVAGRDIVLNGDHYTIAGVGPEGYHGATVLVPDVWIPLTALGRGTPTAETLRVRENNGFIMAARLGPGVSIEQAQGYLDTFMGDLRREFPELYLRTGLVAVPMSRLPGIGSIYVAPFLGLLMGVVGLVLIVTCLNLSGLLLARAAARSREIAVRLALGASRRALAGMLFAETILLFAAGAMAALLVASWILTAVGPALSALPFVVQLDLSLDWRVLGFTAGVAFVAAMLTGLAPSLQGSQTSLLPNLRADTGTPRRQRLRQVFITAQLAFCLVLVVAAGLLVRSLGQAGRVSSGYDIEAVSVAALDLRLGGYSREQAPAMAERIHDELAAIPGVTGVGYARMIPLDGGGLGLGGLRPRGATGRDQNIDTDWNVVSPEYFASVGVPILNGRGFTAADRQGAPAVAIVNERLARETWPGQDPIGQQLENGDFRPGREDTISLLTVVGLAKDAKYRWLGEAPAPFIYVPYAQYPMEEVNYFLRRADGSRTVPSLLPAVREALLRVDPNLPLVRLQPLRESADLGLLPQRVAASIAGSLGVLALILAGIGIYGVTAFAVAGRTREIGVRMALGADRARVMRMVLWQGARLAAAGGAIGLVLSLAASTALSSLLFGVSPFDPVTYALTFAILAFVVLAATFAPARRAAAVDPLASLRSE